MMKHLESALRFFNFSSYIKNKNRYFLDDYNNELFDLLLNSADIRTDILKSGKVFWRAQLGHDNFYNQQIDIDESYPYKPERMKPKIKQAIEGRANPKGIPYLYLSTHKETAMAEVRPWVGMSISVGQFKTVRDLKLINFSKDRDRAAFFIFGEHSEEEIINAIWSSINKAFSEPIIENLDKAEYVPTQMLSEFFKIKGFDGIAYMSSLGQGYNVALFNVDDATQVNCFLYEAKSISFKFKDTGRSYSSKTIKKLNKK